jgi:hypothetical protein
MVNLDVRKIWHIRRRRAPSLQRFLTLLKSCFLEWPAGDFTIMHPCQVIYSWHAMRRDGCSWEEVSLAPSTNSFMWSPPSRNMSGGDGWIPPSEQSGPLVVTPDTLLGAWSAKFRAPASEPLEHKMIGLQVLSHNWWRIPSHWHCRNVAALFTRSTPLPTSTTLPSATLFTRFTPPPTSTTLPSAAPSRILPFATMCQSTPHSTLTARSFSSSSLGS